GRRRRQELWSPLGRRGTAEATSDDGNGDAALGAGHNGRSRSHLRLRRGAETARGTYRSFARHDSIPKVILTNPRQWHIDMLPKWRDSDIHNMTAYLVTLK